LSLALLLHAGVKDRLAVDLHQQLKEEFVATLPEGDFDVNLFITSDGLWTREPH
jgi:hypothetical protein